jgi:hypothetical protein
MHDELAWGICGDVFVKQPFILTHGLEVTNRWSTCGVLRTREWKLVQEETERDFAKKAVRRRW